METESGCGLCIDESSPAARSCGVTTPARSCSPATDHGECRQEELADIATEVTIRASGETSVSSLICSGLQTIHGAPEKEQPERAWEEAAYDEHEVTEQQIQKQECTNEERATNSNVALLHEQVLPEPYSIPMQVY